ncbi:MULTISPECIES: DUF7573 domain-containing protein [Haloferacaceae]|uniref:DUF7573 domain-containing protein n=1 Tax=Halorubrum glutamatedens TaxID=2707018 RepID=A0ABD5QTR0_9EURY|nr:hypothetical protein [Halobellus captivus]
MPEDRSLDDFASAGGGEGNGEAETNPDESIPTDVDPAESTSTWSTDGADCDRCGTTVTRRWHADGNLLCSECVEW